MAKAGDCFKLGHYSCTGKASAETWKEQTKGYVL